MTRPTNATIALLEDLADPETTATLRFPLRFDDFLLTEEISPQALTNLVKLKRLGILTGDTFMALLGVAPIDPINLMGTLMRLVPDGWRFSAIDFSMVRVIARDGQAVSAAMRVDLMGDSIMFLARNRAGQLTPYKTYEVKPSEKTWDEVQALIAETVAAAAREASKP